MDLKLQRSLAEVFDSRSKYLVDGKSGLSGCLHPQPPTQTMINLFESYRTKEASSYILRHILKIAGLRSYLKVLPYLVFKSIQHVKLS